MTDLVAAAGRPAAPARLPGTFRDPAGRLFVHAGRILRAVDPRGVGELETFLATATAQRLQDSGRLARTRLLGAREAEPFTRGLPEGARIAEHEPVPFPSYPYEWTSGMLASAGRLTLELARLALQEGFGLKDATPYNVLFRGSQPVFVDLLSFERRRKLDPVWLAEAQFIRTFLLPLLAARRFGLPVGQWLAWRRDGLEPGQVYEWLGPLERLRRPWLTLVSLPVWLERRRDPDDGRIYRPAEVSSAAKAEFILTRLLDRLGRALEPAASAERLRSHWTGYTNDRDHYSPADLQAKKDFILDCLNRHRPRWLLDIGSNTGEFSRMAAARGASVVSIDSDAAAAEQGWRAARGRGLDVLTLVIDIARPTPALGWRNRECLSFLDRASGRFDMVLMLAVLHHLVVSEGIPLEEILELGAGLTRHHLVIEYVAPSDAMFRRLARGREALHAGLSVETFEGACRRRFEIVRKQALSEGGRILYLLGKRG